MFLCVCVCVRVCVCVCVFIAFCVCVFIAFLWQCVSIRYLCIRSLCVWCEGGFFLVHTYIHVNPYLYTLDVMSKLSCKLSKNENNTDISLYQIYLPTLYENNLKY